MSTDAHLAQCNEAATTIMVLFRDMRRFEITLEEHDGLWFARLQAFLPDHLYPTVYLLQHLTTRQEAISAIQRKWHILFPEEATLSWRDPVTRLVPQPPRRPRAPEGGRE